jgi:hypothetical protein
MLPLASGQACFEMAFPAFLIKKILYRCDLVVIASFLGTEKVRMTVVKNTIWCYTSLPYTFRVITIGRAYNVHGAVKVYRWKII